MVTFQRPLKYLLAVNLVITCIKEMTKVVLFSLNFSYTPGTVVFIRLSPD